MKIIDAQIRIQDALDLAVDTGQAEVTFKTDDIITYFDYLSVRLDEIIELARKKSDVLFL